LFAIVLSLGKWVSPDQQIHLQHPVENSNEGKLLIIKRGGFCIMASAVSKEFLRAK